jgi:hypothetical protein
VVVVDQDMVGVMIALPQVDLQEDLAVALAKTTLQVKC